VRQQNANQIWMATTKAKYGAKQMPVLITTQNYHRNSEIL
jgi:hypothetical protein